MRFIPMRDDRDISAEETYKFVFIFEGEAWAWSELKCLLSWVIFPQVFFYRYIALVWKISLKSIVA